MFLDREMSHPRLLAAVRRLLLICSICLLHQSVSVHAQRPACSSCAGTYAPVCSDGLTVTNECLAACQGLAITSRGVCKGEQDLPVVGLSGSQKATPNISYSCVPSAVLSTGQSLLSLLHACYAALGCAFEALCV